MQKPEGFFPYRVLIVAHIVKASCHVLISCMFTLDAYKAVKLNQECIVLQETVLCCSKNLILHSVAKKKNEQ